MENYLLETQMCENRFHQMHLLRCNQENLYQGLHARIQGADSPSLDGVIDLKNYMQPKGCHFLNLRILEKKGSALPHHYNLSIGIYRIGGRIFPMLDEIYKDDLNQRLISLVHHGQESRGVPSLGGFKVPFFPLSKFTPHKKGLFPRPYPLQCEKRTKICNPVGFFTHIHLVNQ